MSLFRKVLCWTMMVIVPVSMWAADTNAAMLHSSGQTFVNGNPVPSSVAVFAGDEIQTQPESAANLTVDGSTINLLADSFVKFEGSALTIYHGGVSVTTSKGVAVRAGCLTIAPAADGWTEFQVSDVGGVVQIVVRQGSLNVKEGEASTPLSQGQQVTRKECAVSAAKKTGGAAPTATGGILNSPAAIITAGVVVGGVMAWTLAQGGTPLSSALP